MIEIALDQAGTGLDAETVAATQAVAQQVAASEWIGPLAPIALSPFFGLAVLSGAATYGPEWLETKSVLFSEGSALNNPLLFWTMLVLAVLTSLPRFTKVSKPLALAAENLEAYSAIIILGVVRFLGVSTGQEVDVEPLAAAVPLLATAGLTSVPVDIFMALFAALNVIVINGVKLFFEFLVWLVPFPTIDAMLEAGNKSLCAALMGLYMFSPLLASVLNLILLGVCLVVFGWCYRRLAYYREIIAGPALAWLIPSWFGQKDNMHKAFCDEPFDGLPRLSLLKVIRHAEKEFEIEGRWLWKRRIVRWENCTEAFEPGLIIQKVVLTTADGQRLVLHHRRWVSGDARHVAANEAPKTDVQPAN